MESDTGVFPLFRSMFATLQRRRSLAEQRQDLFERQKATRFIQDVGQYLNVSQVCINSAIVYMHRFYVLHKFADIDKYKLSIAALFLATKIEGQNKKLEHVIKVAQQCFEQNATPLDVKSLAYSKKHNEIVILENILLQTIGFHLEIQHPHVFVEKVCHFVKASQELAQISYFLATTSLHVTTMCLRYKPSLVACVCFHVACKWSNWKIEPCSEGKEWYYYIDKTLTLQYLETLTQEFIAILEASPLRLKKSFIKQKNACESKSILDKSSNSGNACESKSILDESSNSGKHSSFSSSKIDFLRRGSSLGLSSVSFNLCTDINEKSVAKAEEVEKSTAPAQPSPCKKRKHKMELSHSISTLTDPEEGNKEELRHTSSVDAKESMHSLNNVSRNSSHISNDPLDVLARCDAEFKRKNMSAMNSSNGKLSVTDHSDVVIQRPEKSVAKAEEVEKSTAPAQPPPCKKRKHKMEISHSISTLTDPEEGNKEELRHRSSVDAKESMHSLNNVSRNSSHISNDPLDVLARCDAEFKRKNVSVMNSSNSKLSVIDHSDVVIQRHVCQQEAVISVKGTVGSDYEKKPMPECPKTVNRLSASTPIKIVIKKEKSGFYHIPQSNEN